MLGGCSVGGVVVGWGRGGGRAPCFFLVPWLLPSVVPRKGRMLLSCFLAASFCGSCEGQRERESLRVEVGVVSFVVEVGLIRNVSVI